MATDDFQERLRRIQTQRLPEGSSLPDPNAPAMDDDDLAPSPPASLILLTALIALPLGIALGVVSGLYYKAALGMGHNPLILGALGSIYALVLGGFMAGFVWRENLPLALPACLVGLIGAGIGLAGVLVL